jgi:ABC-type transport system substrate-binding protein
MRASVRRWAALALSAALALGLCGCDALTAAEEPSPSESETVQVSATPTPTAAKFALGYAEGSTLHPLKTTDQSCLDVCSLVYEGLYALDDSFAAQPVLAQSAAESEDGLTWTITIRADAVFSDGTPVTAEQVASSLWTAKSGGTYAARLSGVTAVTAGDGAVYLTLSAPNGNLPALLDVPIVLETGEDRPLGTGAYYFDTDGDDLRLRANRNWWQEREPLYDVILLTPTQSLEDRIAAFDGGTVTAVTTDFNAANALGYSGTYETHDYPTSTMLFLGFNCASGPCTSAEVRRAISRTCDRETIVTALLSGHGDAAALPVFPRNEQYSTAVAAGLSYDMEAAAAGLEGAGYTMNEEGVLTHGRSALSLTMIVNRESLAKQTIANNIAAKLEELGITVTVEALDWDDYSAALAAGNFDLYLGEVKLTADFDITSLVTGGLNYGGYQNGAVSIQIQTWKASSGQARLSMARTLYGTLADDPPFAVLCFKENSLLIRWGMVNDLSPAPNQPFAGVENWQVH